MKKNNRGLTLVELLVAIAIFGIISIAIFGFMITGSQSYKSTSTDVNIQYEAQLTMNQLQDLIIDSSKVEILEGSTGAKVYQDSLVYEILWQKDSHKLIYNKTTLSDTEPPVTEEYLISGYVTGFEINSGGKVVRISASFTIGEETYDTFHNITLRNEKGMVSENPGNTAGITFSIDGPIEMNRDEVVTLKTLVGGITNLRDNYTVEWNYVLYEQNVAGWSSVTLSSDIFSKSEVWDDSLATWVSNIVLNSNLNIMSNYKFEVTASLKDKAGNTIKTDNHTININMLKLELGFTANGPYNNSIDITVADIPMYIYYNVEGVSNYKISWEMFKGIVRKVTITDNNSGLLIITPYKLVGGHGTIEAESITIGSNNYTLDNDVIINVELTPPGHL